MLQTLGEFEEQTEAFNERQRLVKFVADRVRRRDNGEWIERLSWHGHPRSAVIGTGVIQTEREGPNQERIGSKSGLLSDLLGERFGAEMVVSLV